MNPCSKKLFATNARILSRNFGTKIESRHFGTNSKTSGQINIRAFVAKSFNPSIFKSLNQSKNSPAFSNAAAIPLASFPPAVAKNGCPPPPPWMNFPNSRTTWPALRFF